jgi:hypothetical protein
VKVVLGNDGIAALDSATKTARARNSRYLPD